MSLAIELSPAMYTSRVNCSFPKGTGISGSSLLLLHPAVISINSPISIVPIRLMPMLMNLLKMLQIIELLFLCDSAEFMRRALIIHTYETCFHRYGKDNTIQGHLPQSQSLSFGTQIS